jgi:small subunit ribosomal protein S16
VRTISRDAIAPQEVSEKPLAVRIRLTRVGATKQPSYRFVVADSRNARDGRSIETLGHYNPRSEPVEINVDAEKATAWMAKGAKPSATVERLFRQVGIMPDAK